MTDATAPAPARRSSLLPLWLALGGVGIAVAAFFAGFAASTAVHLAHQIAGPGFERSGPGGDDERGPFRFQQGGPQEGDENRQQAPNS